MRRILATIVLAHALAAAPAAAFGIQGTVTKTTGGGAYPCDIDIIDRQTGLPVVYPGDTTIASGAYVLNLPNGRYDLRFIPAPGSHVFNGDARDVRVNSNMVTQNMSLPTGHYLNGRVVDTGGAPVAGTNIRFKDAGGNAPNNVQDDGAGADGTFHTLVDPGVWNVELIPPVASHRVPVERPAQNLTADVNLGDVVVVPGFVITSTVTDLGFFPIADAKITVRPAGGGTKLYTPLNTTTVSGVATVVVPAGTWDFSAIPPPGQSYATRTARAITPGGDLTLPNFALPDGISLTALVVGPTAVAVPGVDVDVDSLPAPVRRLETPNDATDAGGNFAVLVTTGDFRVTLNPPVATKLLSYRLDSLRVANPTNLGTITLQQGHWVSATVLAPGSATPVAGANLDFIRVSDGTLAVTIDDVTNASGFARVVTDKNLYRLRVLPPNANYDTLEVFPFRSLADTTLTLTLPLPAAAAPASPGAGLSLASPWPNPSRGGALSVAFATTDGPAELSAWDVAGRRLAVLWRGETAGTQRVVWRPREDSGAPVPAGVYWLRLSDGRHAESRRFVLMP